MIDEAKNVLSRRRFLQLTGGLSAGAVVAACAPTTAPTGGDSASAPADNEAAADGYTGGTMV